MGTPRHLDAFEIVSRLGGGGMAEVFLGRTKGEVGLEKPVAIKRLNPDLASDESFLEMLLDEARVAANLNHVNIAQTYDLRRCDDTYYIILEYVHGQSLHQLIRRFWKSSTLAPTPMVAYVMANLCAGLDYAHHRCDPEGQPLNIVHRDVSPDNVMVSFEGEIKLIDFGVVKATQRLHETVGVKIKGKAIYMSPEQALAEPLDHRADIYSAGIVLYELLTLRNPLLGTAPAGIPDPVRPIIPSPVTVRPDIDPDLERICMKALALDREQRYPSAGEMELALEHYLRDHPYTRRELADWMNESFAEDQDRLRRVLSGEETADLGGLDTSGARGEGPQARRTRSGSDQQHRSPPVSVRSELVKTVSALNIEHQGSDPPAVDHSAPTNIKNVDHSAPTAIGVAPSDHKPTMVVEKPTVDRTSPTVVEVPGPRPAEPRPTRWFPIALLAVVTTVLAVVVFWVVQSPEPLPAPTAFPDHGQIAPTPVVVSLEAGPIKTSPDAAVTADLAGRVRKRKKSPRKRRPAKRARTKPTKRRKGPSKLPFDQL